jgi:hypothetical protein
MFAEYSQRLANFKTPAARFDVYLYKDRKDYVTLIRDALPNTGGIFIPKRNLLAAFLIGQGRDSLRRTIQHEAFHQFAHTAIGPNLPIWLNEGMAQVFEEGIWTGSQFSIGQVPPRRLRQLQHDIKTSRMMAFRDFLDLTDVEWQKDIRTAETGASRYSQAWAMTHFLVFAIDENGAPRYRARLVAMLKLIREGLPAPEAFKRTFSDNIEGFEDRFLEFTDTLKPTREATLLENQNILADMLVQLNEQGIRFDDIDEFRETVSTGQFRLRYTKGQIRWSTETDPTIYFKDAQGRTMSRDQLYFSLRGGAPLPDLVSAPTAGIKLRTIFHEDGNEIDHETVFEK